LGLLGWRRKRKALVVTFIYQRECIRSGRTSGLHLLLGLELRWTT
jgi:hypothetical protein